MVSVVFYFESWQHPSVPVSKIKLTGLWESELTFWSKYYLKIDSKQQYYRLLQSFQGQFIGVRFIVTSLKIGHLSLIHGGDTFDWPSGWHCNSAVGELNAASGRAGATPRHDTWIMLITLRRSQSKNGLRRQLGATPRQTQTAQLK